MPVKTLLSPLYTAVDIILWDMPFLQHCHLTKMYDIITKAKCLVDYQHFSKTLRKVSKTQGATPFVFQHLIVVLETPVN
jgi:hypothetical protein